MDWNIYSARGKITERKESNLLTVRAIMDVDDLAAWVARLEEPWHRPHKMKNVKYLDYISVEKL